MGIAGCGRSPARRARALIVEPEFIIADEPISALDMSIRAHTLNLLRHMQKERGITYLFIAHDLSVMRYISDRIAVIHKGDIVELADAEELVTHAIHPYTRSLLSAIPMPSPRRERQKSCWSMTLHARLLHGGSPVAVGAAGPVTGCSTVPPRPKTGAGNRKLFLAFFSLWPLCLLTFVLCSTTITGVAL